MREAVLFLAAALLHEAGHILCAALLNIPFSGIAVRPCGAVMTFDFSRTTYFRELCVHAAGGAAGILSAVLTLLIYGDAAVGFAGMSVTLSVLNLLPAEGFDGGGILACLLAPLLPPRTAALVCGIVSAVTHLFLWTAVLWIEFHMRVSVMLLLFVLYLLIFQSKIVNF